MSGAPYTTIEIKVKWKHIILGWINGLKQGYTLANTCPVALAAKDAGLTYPCVGTLFMYSPELKGGVFLPRHVADWIKRFDSAKLVFPFRFVLTVFYKI